MRRKWFEKTIAEQRIWIHDCGGNLTGYITLYSGTWGRPMEEVFQIYMADTEALKSLEKRLEILCP